MTDPGAGDTAMAVCYPHLDVMKKCFDKNKPSFDLTTLREEFCTLSVAKAKKYTSKEACVLEMKKAEEAGQRGPEELVKIYSAGISAYKR